MKNEVLYIDRKLRNMSLVEFAKFLGIPYRTYVSYEYCERSPRQKHAKKIMEKLNLKDGLVFFPDIYVDYEPIVEGESIIERISIQMNAMSKRSKAYSINEVSMIAKAVRSESLLRRFKKINFNTKSTEGKNFINKEAAKIANKLQNTKRLEAYDVALYKRCRIFEYEHRTSKSTWGFENAREHYGFEDTKEKTFNL